MHEPIPDKPLTEREALLLQAITLRRIASEFSTQRIASAMLGDPLDTVTRAEMLLSIVEKLQNSIERGADSLQELAEAKRYAERKAAWRGFAAVRLLLLIALAAMAAFAGGVAWLVEPPHASVTEPKQSTATRDSGTPQVVGDDGDAMSIAAQGAQ